MKIKNKKEIVNKPILKYYVHLLENDQPIKNYEFIKLSDFLKKTKKETVSEIFISDLLDYYIDSERTDLIKEIISKLDKNSKLYIQGTDPKLLSSSYLYGQIDINIFKAMIFGNGNKKNITNISDIRNIINSIDNMKINEIKFINAIQYYIECYKA